MSGRHLAFLLIGWTALRLIVAAVLPLTPDEAYYWVWSRALAPGYLDHPPMVALWIRAGTGLAGSGPLGVRLLGPLSALAGSALLYRAAIDLAGRDAGWRAVLLLNATLLFGAGAVTMTPDTPLLFFWTAALWAMGRLVATGSPRWWLTAGAATGLALCSKYTAALLPAGIGLWLLCARGQRRWLAHPLPWASAVLGLALFAPTLWWNARHGWASFVKQGSRGAVFQPAGLLAHVGELLGGQAGLATPLIFLLCLAGIGLTAREAFRQREPRATLLACLTVPAATVFIEHALGDRVQANWPAIIYPGAVIAACRLGRRWRGVMPPAIALGAALTFVVYVQGATALLPLSRRMDPSLRLAGGYDGIAAQVQAMARRLGASFIAADDYGPAATLAYLGPACLPTVAIEPRWALFSLPPAQVEGQVGLLIRSARRREAPSMADWTGLVTVGTLDRGRRGRFAERYIVYRGIARAGADTAVRLPCRVAPASPTARLAFP